MSAPTGAQATHEGAREVAGRLFDVAVVGAGPVGLALAALVGRRGWEVVVLERRPVPIPCRAPSTSTTRWPGSSKGLA